MKKFILVLVVCLLCLTAVSCDAPTKSLTQRCDEIVSAVAEMVNSDEYVQAMIGGISAYNEEISKIKAVDFSKVQAKYELGFSQDELLKKLYSQKVDVEKLPEPIKNKLSLGLGSSLASLVNSKAGSDKMAVSAIFSAGDCFVDESIKENKYLLYVFEPGCSMLISFVPREDGAVTSSGTLILNEAFKNGSAEQIEASFKELGCGGISAKEIK